jgi:hypothetical protein
MTDSVTRNPIDDHQNISQKASTYQINIPNSNEQIVYTHNN